MQVRVVSTMACVALLVAGCGSREGHNLAEAEAKLAKGEIYAAAVTAKAALQEDPNSLPARDLLARTLIASSDPVAAAMELRKIVSAPPGSNDPKQHLRLAQALHDSRQFDELSKRFADVTDLHPSVASDIRALLASAALAAGQTERAQKLLAEALRGPVTSALPTMISSEMALANGDRDKALAEINSALAAYPNDANAWLRKGAILAQAFGNRDEAIAAFSEALKRNPGLHVARSNLIFALMASNDRSRLKAEISEFKKLIPNHPQTKYFDAYLAYKENKLTVARDLCLDLLKFNPDSVLVLALAGKVDLQLGESRQAEQRLAKALTLAPRSASVRQDLTAAYLKSGHAEAALQTIMPLIESDSSNGTAQHLAGEANIQAGNLRNSVEHLELATKLDPTNTAAKLQLILTRARTIDIKKAITEIRELASGDKGIIADIALINLLSSIKDVEGSLQAASNLEKKTPQAALGALLRGDILLKAGALEKAKIEYERATKLQPDSVSALTNLGIIDIQLGKPEAAKNRLAAILKNDPKNYDALMGQAKILDAMPVADPQAYIKTLEAAIAAKSTAAEPRTRLVAFHLGRKEFKPAADAAANASAALPNDPEVMDALGKSQIANGELNQAMATYARLVNQQSRSSYALARLASVQLAADKPQEAERTLRRALQIDPGFKPAIDALLKLAVTGKRNSEAIEIARGVQKAFPKSADGLLIEAEVRLQTSGAADAMPVYRKAMAEFPQPKVAMRAYGALRMGGRDAEAAELLSAWTKKNPTDTQVLAIAADLSISRHDYAIAEQQLRSVLKLDAKNVAALNNLAWVLLVQHKPESLQYAQQAADAMPETPGILDTLALAQAEAGKFPEALATQQKALKITPNDLGLRLNLAKILIKSGDKKSARKELEALIALGKQFPAQAEAGALLKSL